MVVVEDLPVVVLVIRTRADKFDLGVSGIIESSLRTTMALKQQVFRGGVHI